MAIQVAQITGDTVELVFNPAEDDLHVGENLSVVGRHDSRGLIVQVIELQAIFSASLLSNRDQRLAAGPPSASPAAANAGARSPRRRKTPPPGREVHGLYLAIAKIRKMTDPAWQPWDGWLPTGAVSVTKTTDHDMLRHCIPESEHPLWLGKTLAGEPLHIDTTALGAINLIVGAEGSGTSHLVQVLVSEIIDHGLPCVIFDSRGAYARLSRTHAFASQEERSPIVHLVVGETLKLGLSPAGLDTLATMLRQCGLSTTVAMYFSHHIARHLARRQGQHGLAQPSPFLGIEELIHLAHNLEAEGQAVAGGAILGCLDAIKQTQVFAAHPAESTGFQEGYARIRHGGALVIDLSKLPGGSRTGIVASLVGILREISADEMAAAVAPSPCLFFDDAQSLVARRFVSDVRSHTSHLGPTSFFVTGMVSRLADYLQAEVDNLFLCHLASDDVRQLSKRSRVDTATLRSVGRRLRTYHSLLVGRATGGYPIIFAVDPPDSGEITSQTAALSQTPATLQLAPGTPARPRFSPRAQAPVNTDLSLPLFPDETPPLTTTLKPRDEERIAALSQSSTPTLERVTAMWDHVVKRVARRRRILETILASARPLRVTEQRLVLSFPPQHRFQQELVESEEYRSLLEEELKKALGVGLEVTTEVYPT
jgi:uncharacterized protein